MKIVLDLKKSILENAAAYYEKAKAARKKAGRVEKAIAETKNKVGELEKKTVEKEKKVKVKEVEKKEWFEKFHWFFTSNDFLVIAGRDAKQNDFIYSKHLQENDLFFHADIQGAPATVLKTEGREVDEQSMLEAAQWAASYSSAWKKGFHSIDVYCAKGGQVKKYSTREFVGKGAFMVYGMRRWFRNTLLKLIIAEKEGKPIALPSIHLKKPINFTAVTPGNIEKKDAAEGIKTRLNTKDIDRLMQLLPAGRINFT